MTNIDPTSGDIDAYLAQFIRALRGVPREDREDFAAEIRSHLMLRATSVGVESARESAGWC